MVCAFHHTGEYNPSVSSIRIREKESGAGYFVVLLEDDGPEGFACDRCRGLARPMCAKVCREEKDLSSILELFGTLARKEKKSGGPCI